MTNENTIKNQTTFVYDSIFFIEKKNPKIKSVDIRSRT